MDNSIAPLIDSTKTGVTGLEVTPKMLVELPEELRFQILAEVLRFPNGLHTDRWTLLLLARVRKFLSIPTLGHMVSEALFNHNTVIIKLQHTSAMRTPWNEIFLIPRLVYPNRLLAHHVKNLELRIGHSLHPDFNTLGTSTTGYGGLYLQWLQKLANHELGFDRLDTFKILFLSTVEKIDLQLFLQDLLEFYGPMQFPCKKLLIEVSEKTFEDTGHPMAKLYKYRAALEKYLTASEQAPRV
ncbi:hypothetical protein N0V90_000047 [Kalmusia sp. IMI 367209]|nr:hypothetical protein N0V90_000047 [Kalmusia sp. IMI 367209]